MKDIIKWVGNLGRHLDMYSQHFNAVGNTLNTTLNHYIKASKEFKKIERKEYWYKVICDFWNKHELLNWDFSCDCEKKYWYNAMAFRTFMFWKWKIHTSSYTAEDRKEFYLLLKNRKEN